MFNDFLLYFSVESKVTCSSLLPSFVNLKGERKLRIRISQGFVSLYFLPICISSRARSNRKGCDCTLYFPSRRKLWYLAQFLCRTDQQMLNCSFIELNVSGKCQVEIILVMQLLILLSP